ncbi:MAG: choice-of-anchor D domain-containing protein [Chlorobiota bacterium]
MKKIILYLFFISSFSLFAQNHYMIPDIGAPDMAIYVELVAPHDQKGYFGTDGFFLPGVNGEVDFNVTKNADLVEFGPTVVSWEGRLVSTHIFVKRTANPTQVTPDPAWQVEFSVDGTTVPAPRDFTFSIVQPQTLGNNGDITGINETVFGEGNLGIRSERGAIIVDSLILKDNTTYTITTNDPDGNISNGNQGFFPAIILSKGPIIGNSSIISVSSTNKHAGPGGGGGGGSFQDRPDSRSGGSNGGDGFTGGGKGGTNRYLTSSGDYRNLGSGTSSDGTSFNGIPSYDPEGIGGWEASYGGTGHPFGVIGVQSLSGSNADNQGGYGGGSGYRNDTQGGAGGYATAGEGNNVSGGTTGGKIHGNDMTVPLAGGSGGAGGNPEASFFDPIVSSGDGGGGGGALLLFAREIDGVSIEANGHNGNNGNDDSDGGPGSGGAAVIMSKNGIDNSTLTVSGGSRSGRDGGAGRVRFDGYQAFTPISSAPDDASEYRGISTDSSNIIRPRHRLTGTHEPGKEILIYIKSETTDWQLLRNPFSPGSVSWGVNLDFDEFHEDEYYISAVQSETQVVDDYTFEPVKVLSQAATNILRFGEPDIYFPTDTTFDVVNCTGATLLDSIQIQSIGGDYLFLSPWKLAFGDRGISFTPYVPAKRVIPNGPDSLSYIYIDYTKLDGQSGVVTDTLYIFHDGVSFNDTVAIAININLQDVDVSFLNEQSTQIIDTLDLGVICKGELATAKFNIRNDSELDINNLNLSIVDEGSGIAASFDVTPNTIGILPESQTSLFDVNFQDLSNTAYPNGVFAKLILNSDECPDGIDTLVLKVTVAETELAFDAPGDILNFGNVNPNQTKDMVVTVTNVGDKPALIDTPPTALAPFSFKGADQPLPYLLQPISVDPSAKLELTYTFAPVAEGNYNYSTDIASLFNSGQGSCDASKTLNLVGTSSLATIDYDTLNFGILYECDTAFKELQIKNTSNDTLILRKNYRLIDENPANYFTVPFQPDTLFPGRFNSFGIDFIPPTNPSTSGVKTAILQFELDKTGDKVFEAVLIAEVDTFQVMMSPGNPFDLGDVPVGVDVAPKQLTLNNQGKLRRTLTGFTTKPDSKLTITQTGGFPVIIQPGGTQDFDVDIDLGLTDLGPFSEDIVANFAECDNSIPIEVIANGVEANLIIPTNLDLGVKSPCLDETIQVEFQNTGDAQLVLDSVMIKSGQDTLDFKVIDQVINKFTGANSYFETFEIITNGLPFGEYKALLTAFFSANGQNLEIQKFVTADIKSGIVVTDDPTDFGKVFVGGSETRTVNISIDDTAPFAANQDITVEANDINLDPNAPEFQFGSPYFITLNSNNNNDESFDITFSPQAVRDYGTIFDLKVTLENGCTYFVPFDMLASGTEGDTLYVYSKDMLEVDPNIDNYKIPIYGRISNIANEQDKTVDVQLKRLRMSFNKTVYFPMSLTNGSLLSLTTDPVLTTIELDMDSPVSISENESILTEIEGATLLGNEKENLIIIESSIEIQDSSGVSHILTNNSFFNLTVCQEGGDRLLEYMDELSYDIQPINGKLSISATFIEPGMHKISIMDMAGKKRLVKEFYRNKGDENKMSIQYDISEYSTGIYYVLIETPARFKTEKIVIVK